MKAVFAALLETPVYSIPNRDGRKKVNTVLMGTWLGISEKQGKWLKVTTAGPDGWVHQDDTRNDRVLKLFFSDVGQGDAVLIETPSNQRILVDCGPNDNIYNYLSKWQYSYLLNSPDSKVHIDAVIITHFDADHYEGLIPILNDRRFSFGTIYHNGIARFQIKKSNRPSRYNENLGKTKGKKKNKVLLTYFSSMSELLSLEKPGETAFQKTFSKFVASCKVATSEGRLNKLKLLTKAKKIPELTDTDNNLSVNVLGPIIEDGDEKAFKWFSNSSHTRNGHSVVFKLSYGEKSILLGGDLNSQSERYLLDHHTNDSVFNVDVAKSCHHGSSDFSIAFLKSIDAAATVISSGDNEIYSHPRADAIGAVAKYSSSKLPLVFSSELSRSVKADGSILYGMINLRTNGKEIVMAQMKEAGQQKDLWDSYAVPFTPTNQHKS